MDLILNDWMIDLLPYDEQARLRKVEPSAPTPEYELPVTMVYVPWVGEIVGDGLEEEIRTDGSP